jgi:hypothetical protein
VVVAMAGGASFLYLQWQAPPSSAPPNQLGVNSFEHRLSKEQIQTYQSTFCLPQDGNLDSLRKELFDFFRGPDVNDPERADRIEKVGILEADLNELSTLSVQTRCNSSLPKAVNNPQEAPNVGAPIPRSSALFEQRAAQIMQSLISDFGFTDVQAAGILGNIAYETTGFRVVEEINASSGGTGGIGYAMWTGPRRLEFEEFVRENSLDPTSPAANYNFLKQDLKTKFSSVVKEVKWSRR